MADRRRLFRPVGHDLVPVGMNYRPRCFPKHKNRHRCKNTSLNSQQWIFVRKGLDDLRKGCPPCQGLITKGPQEGFLPLIYHQVPPPVPKTRENKLPKEAAVFAKLSPAQRARKAFIEDIEAHLARHPLALYPNLEDDLPVELLLKVLEVLDPDRKLEDTWAYCQDIRKRTKEPTKCLNKNSGEVSPRRSKKPPVSHSGKWVYEEKKPRETDTLRDLPLHENIRKEVGDFCNWVATLNSYKPEWVKIRYGAWYLNTKLWKRQRADEPLVDPKILLQAQDENVKKKLQEKEDLFEELHGTVAFKDFILSRGYRMPSVSKESFWRDLLEGLYSSLLFMGRGQNPDKIRTLLLKIYTTQTPGQKDELSSKQGPLWGMGFAFLICLFVSAIVRGAVSLPMFDPLGFGLNGTKVKGFVYRMCTLQILLLKY
ncbi:protein FAM47E isoform X2 [Elephas maximus indicus]|uniref:protein FAM47E isoform X2 n=1 Tax=Elephas maximus indicus TaxID=99487 RepID=UPI002116135C|nr:protein FAM47E isoform X2 [Elephas maximus indicus]